jgi:hypothetical protein
MDSQYLQQQRFLLQKRVRRLNSCDHRLFHSAFVQFWNFLKAHPLFAAVLAKLDAEAPSHEEDLNVLLKQGDGIPVFEREEEAMAFTFRLLQHCAGQPVDGRRGPEVNIGHAISNDSEFSASLNAFRDAYLEPFYEHLDEALDQQAAVLSLLLKYKRKVEWFERKQVAELAGRGERTLAEHLYAYLFDQGLNFHIEPQSASGEADLVASELVLDAKVFDGDRRSVAYVKSGVNQLLTYTRDFHQNTGYLVVYKTCAEDLQFSFERTDSLVPFITLSGKTLFLLVVDICEHEKSASKRGTNKAYRIAEDDLSVTLAEAGMPSAVPPPAPENTTS